MGLGAHRDQFLRPPDASPACTETEGFSRAPRRTPYGTNSMFVMVTLVTNGVGACMQGQLYCHWSWVICAGLSIVAFGVPPMKSAQWAKTVVGADVTGNVMAAGLQFAAHVPGPFAAGRTFDAWKT